MFVARFQPGLTSSLSQLRAILVVLVALHEVLDTCGTCGTHCSVSEQLSMRRRRLCSLSPEATRADCTQQKRRNGALAMT